MERIFWYGHFCRNIGRINFAGLLSNLRIFLGNFFFVLRLTRKACDFLAFLEQLTFEGLLSFSLIFLTFSSIICFLLLFFFFLLKLLLFDFNLFG